MVYNKVLYTKNNNYNHNNSKKNKSCKNINK